MNNILCFPDNWFASQIMGVKKNNKDITSPIRLDKSLYLTQRNAIKVETFKSEMNRHNKKNIKRKKLIFNSKKNPKKNINIKMWPKKIKFLKQSDNVQIKGLILIFLIILP